MWTPPQEHGGDVPAPWQAPGPGMQQWTPQASAQPDAAALQQEVADLRQQVRSLCRFPATQACTLPGCLTARQTQVQTHAWTSARWADCLANLHDSTFMLCWNHFLSHCPSDL